MIPTSQDTYDEWGWFIDIEHNKIDDKYTINDIIKKFGKKTINTDRFYKKLYTIFEETQDENGENNENNENNEKKRNDETVHRFYHKNIFTTLLISFGMLVYYNSFKSKS